MTRAKIQHIIGYDCEVSGANGPVIRGFISAEWMDEAQEKFDRWLEAHDREVAAKAWDEGASALADSFWDGPESGNPGVNPYKNGGTL